MFGQVVASARAQGLVKDRLRLKDASHVIADIAVPTTLALVAQARDKLLAAAHPFDPIRVEGERINIELLRKSSTDQEIQQRLLARVTHLREMLLWIDELPAPEDASVHWPKLLEQRQLAHKIFADQENPKAGDKTRSTVDLAVNTFVPPKREPANGTFVPDDFVEDAESERVICPAGQRSRYRDRDAKNRTTTHRFARKDCQACTLLSQCMKKLPKRFGRNVRKNDYAKEYRQVREKADTQAYLSIRSEHPKVERKLGEVLNRHGGRRARYRGTEKVLMQELMAGTATNIKRIAKLAFASNVAATAT